MLVPIRQRELPKRYVMDRFDKVLCKQNVPDVGNFWKSIRLYVQKPHVVNRRLAGSEIVIALSYSQLDVVRSLHDHLLRFGGKVGHDGILGTLKGLNIDDDAFKIIDVDHLFDDWETYYGTANNILIINKLLPKNTKVHASGCELVTFGKQE